MFDRGNRKDIEAVNYYREVTSAPGPTKTAPRIDEILPAAGARAVLEKEFNLGE